MKRSTLITIILVLLLGMAVRVFVIKNSESSNISMGDALSLGQELMNRVDEDIRYERLSQAMKEMRQPAPLRSGPYK